MPKYSVVIPVYQVASYLAACLDSVLAQRGGADYELILVDDGSTDGSGELCDRYAAAHPQIRVLHIENGGVSHARNLGLSQARGEFVLFLDGDDLWEPELLERLDPLAEPGVDILAFGYSRMPLGGGKTPCKLPLLPEGESGENHLRRLFRLGRTPCSYPVCYVYRRAFLLENGLRFREELAVSEDFVFNMQALSQARQVRGCDEALYVYQMREGSATATLTERKLLDNLTTKAEFFRRYPVPAMANLYGNNALLVAKLDREAAGEALAFLKQNRDILEAVSEKPLKLGALLVRCFGDYGGARLYRRLRRLTRRLQGRKE